MKVLSRHPTDSFKALLELALDLRNLIDYVRTDPDCDKGANHGSRRIVLNQLRAA
jgi:hypothetical protein